MDYLFFDIECASGRDGAKVCEFGYVLVDEKFNVLQKENVLIDPDCEFETIILHKFLNHKESEYRACPKFDFQYEKIKGLMLRENTLVVGHSVKGDVEYVGDDCIRYGLPAINCEFVDVGDLVMGDLGQTQPLNLQKMCYEYQIRIGDKLHSADVDAYLTMLVAKKLCEKHDTDLLSLANKFPLCYGIERDYENKMRRKSLVGDFLEECKHCGIFTKMTDRLLIKEYQKTIEQNANADAPFCNLVFSVSENFENCCPKTLFNLIRLIYQNGGKVVKSPACADVFIKFNKLYKDQEVYCRKHELILSCKFPQTQVWSVEEFLQKLNLPTKELNKPINVTMQQLKKKQAQAKRAERIATSPFAVLLSAVDEKDDKNDKEE